jgi:hypothetical protein
MSGQWRLPVALAAVVLLGGALIAWLQPSAQSTAYLDPANTGPQGGHALAAILAGRGTRVTRTGSASQAGRLGGAGTTILVTNPWLLTAAELGALGQSHATVVLVNADQASVNAVAPEVTVAGTTRVSPVDPGCPLRAATLAGNADLGGTELSTGLATAQRCYFQDGHPTLVRYAAAGREITVLGTGAPFTNQDVGDLGNAALALNLLGGQPRLIWLTPVASPPATGQVSFPSLIPKPVAMVAAELVIAVILLALWRVRRLGAPVPERLPVVVRAAETTEGHGRLYHARRSRDRAAAVLREAAIRRMLPTLGLPPDTAPDAISSAIAQRTGDDPDDVITALAGGPPADDATLVGLADRLDELERKVGVR